MPKKKEREKTINSIDFTQIEKKWQQAWEKAKIFEVTEQKNKKKFYVLEMFPYPSGEGLHMGHAFNYTIGDIYARFKRMQGFNVLYPMGYDSFGLPAENAAIKAGAHPKKYTDNAIKNFIEQQKALGLSYDWSRLVITKDPHYYKWNQFFFIKLYEKGLVYRKKAAVNWCPKCQTVLANEQVHSGKCWRHEDTDVEIRHLEQWFIRTTDYAEELLKELPKLNWPERIKIMQENWIGKSHGINITFTINNKPWPVFTTRPDTIYGVTFMVISAQHPKLFEIVTEKQKPQVEAFLKRLKSVSEKELEEMEKEGVFTGSYAINPINNEKVPVYVGNFVLAEYGSGMVMAVPAHDQRDFEFAKKYNLPVRIVIQPKDKKLDEKTMREAFVEEGILVNSGKFNGLNSKEAIEKISDFLEKQKLGKRTINYKLRDWLISRQRYWGTPIPFIYCNKCGLVSVPEKELPVLLPEKVEFGKGNPLATNKAFIETKCPKCKGKAKRETDTMDTFFDSSWYFLRYCDPKNNKEPFDKEKVAYWNPVDIYIGGAEHACMHLIYARFFVKALRDMGFVKINEPFPRLFNQGMLHGSDGFVMSKSRGNIVNPLDVIKKYGADTLRFYLVSQASPDKDTNWSDEAIEGTHKFILKVVNYFNKVKIGKTSAKTESKLNKTIKEFADDIENLRYNFAIIKLRELFESFGEEESKETLKAFLKMFSLFCPHICEELWHKLGNKSFISLEPWPKADEKKINPLFEQQEKATEQLKQDINQILRIIKRKPKAIYIYTIPKELEIYDQKELEKVFSCKVQIMANNKATYDPQKKASKAKPGKPALYIE
ncbi:MAG: leucine--tRNA ligase [Candidatus Pacearchaeota archaeon]|nr:leucine--tRNA ligase [Candidatus Pacearchaeota archaeon]